MRERSTLSWRLSGLCGVANGVGCLFTVAFVVLIAPSEQRHVGLFATLLMTGAFAAIAFPLEGWWAERSARSALGWVGDGRRPEGAEQEATLRLPLRLAAQSFLAWGVCAVLLPLCFMPLGASGFQVVRLAIPMVDGGLVTSAVVFMLVERSLRPVFATALAAGPPPRSAALGVRPRLLLTWLLGSGVPLAGLAFLPLASLSADERTDIRVAVVVLSVTGLVLGLAMTAATARLVADPLRTLQTAVQRVGEGQLDVAVPVDDGGEIGLLQSGINKMVVGLRDRRRLADLFGRQVGAEVARLALEQGTGLKSEQRAATAMFVDMIGSTALAEVLTPDAVVDTLNDFFRAVVEVVAAEGGWVNKFEGDGALCVFGAPAVQPDHAARSAARRPRPTAAPGRTR